MTVYDYSAETISGGDKSLSDFKRKVLLIVNTASECGFTPQYKGLQHLYEKYHDQGFEILGFPCNQFGKQEPGSEQDIETFCQKNYGVTFPMFAKVDVKGNDAHPLFKYLTEEASGMLNDQIKWNFTKFLVDREGHVIDRFAPQTKPNKLESDIEQALNKSKRLGQN
ncbi:glutathione peroxidase [Virgibacillus sp. MSJ-26]|uniref:glutathione peroxidase n=1 Tax=Virgibacillus sp. MSJ-26 TaxID=2841522 RepID=UPI001C103AA2|nr:glutathione peroxidase [Virgibacillus sp. MSJ-26]MBU5467548.1 glutathione peroxidase [Virgibacillus sp. MSJ-26]